MKKRWIRVHRYHSPMRNLRAVLLLTLIALAGSASAWIDTGHMVVASIAYRNLTPKVRQRAEELLKFVADEKSNTFITASCWADDHKNNADREWHYIDLHFRADGTPTANRKPPTENVVWAIEKFSRVLADKRAKPEERGIALRYLLHFVGDIHQPLHCVARDTDLFPNGDRGGQ